MVTVLRPFTGALIRWQSLINVVPLSVEHTAARGLCQSDLVDGCLTPLLLIVVCDEIHEFALVHRLINWVDVGNMLAGVFLLSFLLLLLLESYHIFKVGGFVRILPLWLWLFQSLIVNFLILERLLADGDSPRTLLRQVLIE